MITPDSWPPAPVGRQEKRPRTSGLSNMKNGTINVQKNINFGQWAQEWWILDRYNYVKSRIARGGTYLRTPVNFTTDSGGKLPL